MSKIHSESMMHNAARNESRKKMESKVLNCVHYFLHGESFKKVGWIDQNTNFCDFSAEARLANAGKRLQMDRLEVVAHRWQHDERDPVWHDLQRGQLCV